MFESFPMKAKCPCCYQTMNAIFKKENQKLKTAGYKCHYCEKEYKTIIDEFDINWDEEKMNILIFDIKIRTRYVVNSLPFSALDFISKEKSNQIIQFGTNDTIKVSLIDLLYSYYQSKNKEAQNENIN